MTVEATVGAVTMGAGHPIRIGSITGFGRQAPRGTRGQRGDGDGDVAGRDTRPSRLITLGLTLDTDGTQTAQEYLDDVLAAWDGNPGYLDLAGMPGWPEDGYRFFGRPGEVTPDWSNMAHGAIDAMATFEALDPAGYAPTSEEETLAPGATVVTNPGTRVTDRATITIPGDDTEVTISNPADPDGHSIRLRSIPALTSVVVDLRARQIRTTGGADASSRLKPGLHWWRLQPGANTITVTGTAAGADLDYRPAYI